MEAQTMQDDVRKDIEAGLSKNLKEIWSQGQMVSYLSKRGLLLQQAQQGIRSILHSPLTSVVTVLTVSVVLCILGLFLMLLINVESLLSATKRDLSVSLYLDDRLIDSQIEALVSEIRTRPEVHQAEFWSKSRALVEFRESLGEEAAVLDGLDVTNPLPASIEVQFHEDQLSDVTYDSFVNHFRDYPGIAHLQYNSTFLNQLADMLLFVRLGGFTIVLLLCMICAFVIASTIRLALYTRRNDLAIMRLVGASRNTITVPCFIEGVLQGFIGALGAIFLLKLVFDLVKNGLKSTMVSEMLGSEILFLGFGSSLLIVCVGTLIGGAGAFLAVRKIGDL